jgi:hypothetical protein
MPIPKIPWTTVVNQLPFLLRAVDGLIDSTVRSNAVRETASAVDGLQMRLSAVEEQQRTTADLLKQLAESVNAMAVAADGASRLLKRTLIVASIGGAVAVLALVLVMVLWLRG